MRHSWLALAVAFVLPGAIGATPTPIPAQDDQDGTEFLEEYVQTELERVLDRANEAVNMLATQACWPGRGRRAYESLQREYERIEERAHELLGRHPNTTILMAHCRRRDPEVVPELEARARLNLRIASGMIARRETD